MKSPPLMCLRLPPFASSCAAFKGLCKKQLPSRLRSGRSPEAARRNPLQTRTHVCLIWASAPPDAAALFRKEEMMEEESF